MDPTSRTIKEILSENREGILRSILIVFHVYSLADQRQVMIRFLKYCEQHTTVRELEDFGSFRLHSHLNELMNRMKAEEDAGKG